MLANPRIGQHVHLHYAAKWHSNSYLSTAPYHGQAGTVIVRGKGKPRNHAVRLDDGRTLIVPCGNLRKK